MNQRIGAPTGSARRSYGQVVALSMLVVAACGTHQSRVAVHPGPKCA